MNLSRSAILFAGLGLAAVCIFIFAGDRAAHPPGTTAPAMVIQEPDRISAHGLTLASTHVNLPDDSESYPPGPHADTVNAKCLACHSASMVLYQPGLSAAEWRKEVEKMRDAYGAPIADADIPAIVAYLAAMRESRVK
jgi:hypothetical protein